MKRTLSRFLFPLAAFVGLAGGARAAQNAIQFDGSNDYVTMGAATAQLGASTLTVECWFMKTGTGSTTSTGTGGVTAIPLVTKGRGEEDGTNKDCNYFLGLTTGGVLVADFEAAPASGITAGQNYPVTATNTPIVNNVWYHAAVTYDVATSTWRIYLNATEVGSLVLPAGAAPRADSIQHFGVGTAMTSTGSRAGAFAGVIDEVRVWNVARTQPQIANDMVREAPLDATGLIGRYAFNEGSGTTTVNAVGSGANGTLTNGPVWVAGPVLDGNPPPTAEITSPTDGASVFVGGTVAIEVTATDNVSVAEVELLRDGVVIDSDDTAPFSFADSGLAVGSYTYTARAIDDQGKTGTSAPITVSVVFDPANPPANAALHFDGVNDYVTMGVAPELNVGGPPSNGLTLECWFRKDGAGVTSSSGNGGVSGVPLFGKGRGEAENSNVDCDTFFAISTAGLLVADFEAYPASGITSGQNYPITGSHAPIQNNVWYHAAATYDGATAMWHLYLDGVEVGSASAAAGALPRYDSIQHFAIGTALNSTGVREGAFAGTIDEVRVWAYARSETEIAAARNFEIASAAGLLGRYGLNEAFGTIANNSVDAGGAPLGTLENGPVWVNGAPFAGANDAPTVSLDTPADGASSEFPFAVSFTATAADADGSVARVEFLVDGVEVAEITTAPYTFNWTPAAPGTFAIIARAVDNLGAATLSDAASLTITPSSNQPPEVTPNGPADNATGIPSSTTLALGIVDPEGDGTTVTFYGRRTAPATAGPDFVVATLPDTQFYSENINNRSTIYYNQTQWLVDNRDALNLAFVSHMGDIVQNGDAVPAEWVIADTAMTTIEDQIGTLRAFGIPWGGAPGNHDQTSIGNAGGANVYYNQYFGADRFAGRPYFGASESPTNNNNNYQVFRASGLDFLILHLEYDTRAVANYQAVMDWADAVMKAHPDHRVILTTHWVVNTGNPASFSTQGQNLYNNLRDNPNFFLMLGGHVAGEGRRSDVFEGRTVFTILQDYQGRANGGDGWLRYFVFSPANNTITAKTYSTTLGTFETDADSQFTLVYDMQSAVTDWIPLGMVNVAAGGTTASLPWTGLAPDARYEWYASVVDGVNTVNTAVRTFSTVASVAPIVALTGPADGAVLDAANPVQLVADASDADGSVTKVEFFAEGVKLGESTGLTFEYTWTGVPTGDYALTAVAYDNTGHTTLSNVVNVSIINPSNEPPTVAITAPAVNAVFAAPATVTIDATASDSDGAVVLVEFFAGATKLGEDDSAPFSFTWTNVPAGSYSLTAVATDSDNAPTVSAPVAITVATPVTETLIPRGAVWKFLDNGSDQGVAWRAAGFDDSTWASGPAELGYGDTQVTTVGFGPDANNKYPTTYFRTTFSVANPAAIDGLVMNLQRDDGAIVYINGVEVLRDRMSAATVDYLTYADSPEVGGADETTYYAANIDPAALIAGVNTIAVEVHQQRANSSDISFDLDLIAQEIVVGAPPTVSLTAPADGAMFTAPTVIALTATASDPDGTITKVEFFEGNTKLGEDLTVPYEFSWTVNSGGVFSLTAVATDNDVNHTTSTPADITVVNPANQAPTVAITAPANAAEFTAPATIAIAASASDTDGAVVLVEFFNGATKFGEDADAPYTFDWNGVAAGDYALTAVATDNEGAMTTSAVVNVSVVNPPPVAFSFSENFNSMGTGGTTPPAGWSLKVANSGTSNSTWTTSITGSGSNSVASMVNTSAGLTTSSAPTATNNNSYNAGAPGNTADRMIATSPTTVAGVAIQLQLTNTAGAPISALRIGYDIQRFTAPSSANELPGYWLFYSLDNGTTWTNVAALNPTLAGPSGVIVPNTIGVTTVPPTTFALSSPWAAGATLLFRWIDDNAVATSPDQVHGLDNVTIASPIGNPPTVALTAPANNAVYNAPALINFAATASDSDGTITKVEFFNGGTKLGEDLTSPYTYDWTNVPAGSYALTAVASDNSGNAATSTPVNVTVNPAPGSGTLLRGPYLNMASDTSIVIRWRTSQSVVGRVRYGLSIASLTSLTDETIARTDHEVRLTGLTPYTRYYYSVGSAFEELTPELVDTTSVTTAAYTIPTPTAADYTFRTSPVPGTATDTRIWIVGDCGRGSASQAGGRDAYYNWMGSRVPDVNLQLGDNAYNAGTDTEYQSGFFRMYPTIFRKLPQWSTLGNHDANNGNTSPTANWPYFDMFTFPTAGEAGGVASGTEHYYSFDYGNIHFICLDSQTTLANTSPTAPQTVWLEADLASTTATWIIVFFHHPPYSKGSHNSDSEGQMVTMRQIYNPILEAGGVDLVFTGHSHNYERSVLLDGHYGTSGTITPEMKLDAGNGSTIGFTTSANGVIRNAATGFNAVATVNGAVIPPDGAYLKPLTGPRDHFGAIYNTAGMSGQADGGSLNHTAMYISYNSVGTVNLDINGNTLVATFVQSGGATPDNYTIIKSGAADSDEDGISDEYEIANGMDRFDPLDADLDLDGDALSNRLEHALDTPANVPGRSGLPVLGTDLGRLTLTFNRTREELTYVVQGTDDLKTWTDVATNPGTAGGPVTVIDPNTTSPNRFVRLRISDGVSVVTTTPQGRVTYPLAQNQETAVGFPLETAIGATGGRPAGFISAVGTNTVDDASGGWTPGEFSQAAAPYFLRITGGAAIGRVFPISTSAANTATRLTLSNGGVDLTTLGIVPGTDTFELVPAHTLATLFPTGTLLSGSATTGDTLRLWTGSTWLTYFHDGTNWRRQGAGIADTTLVRPDQGWMLLRRGAPTALVLLGQVSLTDVNVTVPRGASSFVTLLPVTETFAAFPLQDLVPGWSSNVGSPTSGDYVRLWSGSAWLNYYFDGTNWRRQGAGAADGTPLLKPGRPFFIVRPVGTGADILTHSKPY